MIFLSYWILAWHESSIHWHWVKTFVHLCNIYFEPIVQVSSPSDCYVIEYVLHTYCLTQATQATWVLFAEKTINTIGFTYCFLWIWLLTCIICSEWNSVWRQVQWFSACILFLFWCTYRISSKALQKLKFCVIDNLVSYLIYDKSFYWYQI